MRPVLALLVAALTACGSPDVEGTWTGECALPTGTATQVMQLELDLEPAEGDAVVGVGLVEDSTFPGELPLIVEGTLTKKELALDLAYDLPTMSTGTTGTGGPDFGDLMPTLGLEATVKGDTMEGRCLVGVMGFAIGADIVLERQ